MAVLGDGGCRKSVDEHKHLQAGRQIKERFFKIKIDRTAWTVVTSAADSNDFPDVPKRDAPSDSSEVLKVINLWRKKHLQEQRSLNVNVSALPIPSCSHAAPRPNTCFEKKAKTWMYLQTCSLACLDRSSGRKLSSNLTENYRRIAADNISNTLEEEKQVRKMRSRRVGRTAGGCAHASVAANNAG